jgi:hypothetical protein
VHDAEGLLVGGHRADGVDDHLRALPAGELADLLDALLAAGGDDVGGAELAVEPGALSPRRRYDRRARVTVLPPSSCRPRRSLRSTRTRGHRPAFT